MLTESELRQALSNPKQALKIIEKLESERNLIDFVRNGWEALEPGQKFVSGWAVEAICEHLQAVSHGEIKRLLINVPPGCTKSMTTSVFFPAWEWGPRNFPHYRYILAAHEKGLATRDNVRSRDLMTNEWFQDQWGENVILKADENGKEYYVNMKTGFRKSSSCKSGLTGYRGDRLILDDPHSVKGADSEADREEVLRWFSETLPTRLNNANESAIITIMQRVNERDVSGLILAEELGYEHLMLPMEYEPERCCYSKIKPKYILVPKKEIVIWSPDSHSWVASPKQDINEEGAEIRWKADPRKEDGDLLWPERFNREAVTSLQKTLRSHGGSYAEAGQLQQRPSPRGGGMFKLKDWEYVDAYEVPKGGREVRGWDLAATADKKAAFTASCKMKLINDSLYILDVNRQQASPAAVEAMIKNTAKADGKTCFQDLPQDPGQAGKAQKLTIAKLLHGHTFSITTESGSKEERAAPLAAQVEVHNVYLVRGLWNSDFTKEGSLFPNGQFKDQIDAASRAYYRCLAFPASIAPAGGGCVE